MFHVSPEPLLLSEAGIHGLCVSLNTPVLNVEELPVGPARAAIVLFDTGYGDLGLGIAVRSVDTRRAVVYAYRGIIDEEQDPAEAMEVATAFAEGMGFLFDEDLVRSDAHEGRSRALAIWTELTDDAPEIELDEAVPEPATPTLSPPVPLEPAQELVLDEPLGPAAVVSLEEIAAAPAPAAAPASGASGPASPGSGPAAPAAPPPAAAASAPPASAPPRRMSLSRFRQARAEEPAAASAKATDVEAPAAALGRIPLVRVKSKGEEPARPSALLRLLGSF